MDAPLRFGLGHALHAMDARFVLHVRVCALAVQLEDDLLVAADRRVRGVDHLGTPAQAFRVALVHAEEVGGEERRLVAAGPSADLDDHVLLVGGVLRQQRQLELLFQPLDLGRKALLLLAAQRALLLIAVAAQLARVLQRLLRLAEVAIERDDVP